MKARRAQLFPGRDGNIYYLGYGPGHRWPNRRLASYRPHGPMWKCGKLGGKHTSLARREKRKTSL